MFPGLNAFHYSVEIDVTLRNLAIAVGVDHDEINAHGFECSLQRHTGLDAH